MENSNSFGGFPFSSVLVGKFRIEGGDARPIEINLLARHRQ
jgi:hypothetical protein